MGLRQGEAHGEGGIAFTHPAGGDGIETSALALNSSIVGFTHPAGGDGIETTGVDAVDQFCGFTHPAGGDGIETYETGTVVKRWVQPPLR